MNRVIFWKELREQAAILIALVALGAGIIASGATLGTLSSGHDPLSFRGYSEPARLATVVLIAVAGLVVGGTLFAGEYENGTAGFLMHLPAARRRLWVAKILSGLALTAAMTITLASVALAAGVFSGSPYAAWMIWLLEIGIASFAAGAFGSAGTRQVLPACGVGIAVGPAIAGFGTVFVLVASRYYDGEYGSRYSARVVTTTAFAAGPIFATIALLILSYALFTYPDVVRKRVIIGTSPVKDAVKAIRSMPAPSSRFGVRALLWFMWRTWFWPCVILHGMAIIFGMVLLIPDVPPAFVWPAMTVILGVLAGCFVFMPEQLHGVQPFWAERALPPGRLWTAKVLTGLATLLSCCLFVALPMALATVIRGNAGGGYFGSEDSVVTRFVSQMFRTALIGEGFPFFKAFFLWPAYGFAAGVLSSMLFDKALVSVAVGLMTGAATAALWIPSLFGGGLMGWQVWPIPVFVLLLSRWLIRDWTLHRIGRGFGLKKLIGGLTVATLMLSAAIGFRAIEVPLVPEVNDDIAFALALPTNDDKQPGRDLKRALGQFNQQYNSLRSTPAKYFFGPPSDRRQWSQNQTSNGNRLESQLHYTTVAGYPSDRPDMDEWLDAIFSNSDFTDELAKMRGRPPGVFLDPNELNFFSGIPEVESFRNLTPVMLARALQEQARGRPEVAVDYFDMLLTAIRTAKHHTILTGYLVAISNEYVVYAGIARWLERLDHDPILLHKLLSILQAHHAVPADSAREHEMANQVGFRNSIKDPQSWYEPLGKNVPGLRSLDSHTVSERVDAESSLLQFSWNVPWEKERLYRAIGLKNAPEVVPGPLDRLSAMIRKASFRTPRKPTETKDYLAGLPGVGLMDLRLFGSYDLTSRNVDVLARLRGLMLVVALRLYEAEKGRLPEALSELVPVYLPAVPKDPHSPEGKPYRYELSKGRVVYLTERELPSPPPGVDASPPFTRQNYYSAAAVAGAVVAHPIIDMPIVMPGFELGDQISHTEGSAIIAVTGGIFLWPTGTQLLLGPGSDAGSDDPYQMGQGSPGGPSGGEGMTFPAKRIAVAGMGGALAASSRYVPYPDGIEPFGEEDNPLVRFTSEMEPTEVPAGRGIVWSVGQDGMDDGGIWLANRGTNRGDLIFLVPPAVKLQPHSGGRK
jgi:ABC-type transport system involved in cytochrome c biogenesis permease component